MVYTIKKYDLCYLYVILIKFKYLLTNNSFERIKLIIA